ncbi:AAA family ATPase [Aquisalimonas lutea]|uniref:AAA family ATPase n=1 Tax=Aquisalimonas lutea TaxID=1327750 RepID=UPI0025B46829|nr:AAA family ATPase [Aquisalimonas lutea]MDN3519540.1 AAA family ATPase [Aquisalimonas lutea]
MTTATQRPAFPFTAVVGQEALKTALILATIAPALGGVMISGPRGCAKSTLARGLADVHPGTAERFVTLPLGATEEQLIGSLDLQKALDERSVAFSPGLLARAHGGVLYIDEVNLLPDPLVDSLLDVAASGVNRVERDGISHSHAAEFLLIGTMNPDEGELRPQLLDRFGLAVEMTNPVDVAERTAIMRQRVAFEHDPQAFVERYADAQAALRRQLDGARAAYPGVDCPEELETRIVERCLAADVDGVRADITWRKAAAAHAAWQGRDTVTGSDVDAVAELVLSHRRRNDAAAPDTPDAPPPGQRDGDDDSDSGSGGADGGQGGPAGDWGGMPPRAVSPAGRRSLPAHTAPVDPRPRPAPPGVPTTPSAERHRGARESRRGTPGRGPDPRRVDWFRTVAGHRLAPEGSAPPIHYRPARRAAATLNCVLLDTSGSTLDNRALAEAEAVVLGIAERAYHAREQLAILAFGNDGHRWLLTPRRAPKDCTPYLTGLPAGGGTPLRGALLAARDRLARLRRQEPQLSGRFYLLTDGLSRQAVADIELDAPLWVVDTERARVPLGRCREIARALGGQYVPLARAAPTP